MNYNISISSNIFDNYPKDKSYTIVQLEDLLTTFPDHIIPKTKNSGFISGHFCGKQRLDENLISRSLITLDVDHYNSDLTSLEALLSSELNNLWYIAYSTSSHSSKEPKIRIVILLDKEIKTESYKTVVLNFVDSLELKSYIDLDASSKPNQLMFLPARSHKDYKPWFKVNKGELLNPDYYIVDYGLNDTNNDSDNDFDISIEPNKQLKVNHATDPLLFAVNNRPLDISSEKIQQTLEVYPAQPADYKSWLEVGMALHHQYSGKIEGIKTWYEWSKLDTRPDHKHRLKNMKNKWRSFSETINPIRFSTIMKKVADKKIINYNNDFPVGQQMKKNIWRDKFPHTRGKKKSPMNTIENFRVLLKEYNISIDYDVILKRQIIKFAGVAEEDLNKAQPRIESLCIQNDMSSTSVAKYMIAVENEVNTWREFIDSKPWDGVDRFADLCATVYVQPEHEEIKRVYLRAWLMQMIHLTCLNDGVSAKMGRVVLVFQSNQWGGKTTWFKSLCPDTHQRYFKEAVMLDTKSDMSMLKCIQHVFVELGELGSTFKKSDSDSLKNFISDTTDMLNIKYLSHHKSFRRRTVFFGSVNDHTFLQDVTGNTRYLCLPVIECNYTHNIDMQQLHAQLLKQARDGEGYHIDKKYFSKQKELNSTFENESYLQTKFMTVFNTELESRTNKLTLSEVLEKLGFVPSAIRQTHMNEMSRILKTLSFNREKSSPRRWFLPPLRSGF